MNFCGNNVLPRIREITYQPQTLVSFENDLNCSKFTNLSVHRLVVPKPNFKSTVSAGFTGSFFFSERIMFLFLAMAKSVESDVMTGKSNLPSNHLILRLNFIR